MNKKVRTFSPIRITKYYVVTAFSHERLDSAYADYGSSRTVGIFNTYENAKNSLFNNSITIYENYYDYAVIETIPEGLYPTGTKYYEAEYFEFDKELKFYVPLHSSPLPDKKFVWSIG